MEDTFRSMGKFFGYPECCIDAFETRAFNVMLGLPKANSDILREEVSEFKGFLPCLDCALKIQSKEATLESLIINRIATKPFPDSDYREMLTEYKTFLKITE